MNNKQSLPMSNIMIWGGGERFHVFQQHNKTETKLLKQHTILRSTSIHSTEVCSPKGNSQISQDPGRAEKGTYTARFLLA